MPMLRRRSVQLHYESYGDGPVLLLSHGFSESMEMWRGQVEALSRRHRLILWDMRGHGRSDSPEDAAEYSEEATVADMLGLLDAVGAERAIVGGLSLGGYMSLAFHRVHSERVQALLVIDTGPGFKKDEARNQWNERALKTARQMENEGLARAAQGMLTQRDARVIESLPNIQVPVLVIVGADDTPFLNAAAYMDAKIPNSFQVVIPGAGHLANIDQPELFNQAVLNFLDTLPSHPVLHTLDFNQRPE